MNNIKWAMLVSCIKWISCATAVTIAIDITRNPKCLWALLIPALCTYSYQYKS